MKQIFGRLHHGVRPIVGRMNWKVLQFLRLIIWCVAVVVVVAVFLPTWLDRLQSKGLGRISSYSVQRTPAKKVPTDPPIYPPKAEVKISICYEDKEPNTCPPNGAPPFIYVVTPTYTRREQTAELTRLAQTLVHVKNIHWVVAEDSDYCHDHVIRLARRYRMSRTHIASPIPVSYKSLSREKTPRGVSSRRAGLRWVLKRHGSLKNRCPNAAAVIYFADDDNTYDFRIFEQIRTTKKVSVFPVGLIGKQSFSSPIVVNGMVVGFADPWFERRKFSIDMAGFAASVDFILASNRSADVAEMPYKVGFEEDFFLKSLNLEMKDLEPRAWNCTEILVWHTKTVKEKSPHLKSQTRVKHLGSNLEALIQSLADAAVIKLNSSGYKVDGCTNSAGCDTSPLKRL